MTFRVLEFKMEGLQFNPWPGYGKLYPQQGTLLAGVPLYKQYKWVPTLVGVVNLRRTGILFKGVVIL